MRSSFDMFPDSSKEVEVVDRTPADSYPPKIDISPVTGKITELRISKSLIRQLIYKGVPYPVCPRKVYHTLLLRDVVTPPSDSMMKGLYFESKCLGVSANGNAVVDLPRHKKTGVKLIDHDRIDQAVERFNQVKEDYGLIVELNRVQRYHKRRWRDSQCQWDIPIYLDGTLDLISPITTSGYSCEESIIDLKLTRDRDVVETFSNGLFHSTPWGNMEQADFTEAMMYRMIFGEPFVYLVFDYKATNAGFRDIPIITDINDPNPEKAAKASKRMAELNRTIRWAITNVMLWEDSEWPIKPIPKVCNSCQLKDCFKRNESIEV